MNRLRLLLGGLGVVVALYGAWLALSRQDAGQLVEIALWMAGGVALHDAVIAVVVVMAALAGRRVLPHHWQAPAAIGLLVWGSITLMAVPVIGRLGAREDNPTLLDRPYLATWLVATALTLLAVALAGLVRRQRA